MFLVLSSSQSASLYHMAWLFALLLVNRSCDYFLIAIWFLHYLINRCGGSDKYFLQFSFKILSSPCTYTSWSPFSIVICLIITLTMSVAAYGLVRRFHFQSIKCFNKSRFFFLFGFFFLFPILFYSPVCKCYFLAFVCQCMRMALYDACFPV